MRVGADKEYDMAMKFLQPAIGEVCPHSTVQTMARYTVSLSYLICFLWADFKDGQVHVSADPSTLLIEAGSNTQIGHNEA